MTLVKQSDGAEQVKRQHRNDDAIALPTRYRPNRRQSGAEIGTVGTSGAQGPSLSSRRTTSG